MEQSDIATITDAAARVLAARKDVLFGYVFGSAATGGSRKGSDVDLAVYLDPAFRARFFDIRLELLEQFTRSLGSEADVVVLNTAAPFLRYVAMREGIVAFEGSREARIDFELKALNEYFDYQPVLAQYRARLAQSV
ncbi:MAG: nucleotidyltransferase domain-containing protein [Parcubacteria group bacterium]|nr:nucleotidyltransferase domain-containing protein [Parcubacteria group bacterium]